MKSFNAGDKIYIESKVVTPRAADSKEDVGVFVVSRRDGEYVRFEFGEDQVLTADYIAAEAIAEERAKWVKYLRTLRRELASVVSGSDSSARVKPIWEIVGDIESVIYSADPNSGSEVES